MLPGHIFRGSSPLTRTGYRARREKQRISSSARLGFRDIKDQPLQGVPRLLSLLCAARWRHMAVYVTSGLPDVTS